MERAYHYNEHRNLEVIINKYGSPDTHMYF